jgi:hypothetical protein
MLDDFELPHSMLHNSWATVRLRRSALPLGWLLRPCIRSMQE